VRPKGELQISFSGKRGICLNLSHKCPLYPRKRSVLVGEGILTCGLGYSLRLPIPLVIGNSGHVQISLPKGPSDMALSLEVFTPATILENQEVKISAHSCGAAMDLHHFPFRIMKKTDKERT